MLGALDCIYDQYELIGFIEKLEGARKTLISSILDYCNFDCKIKGGKKFFPLWKMKMRSAQK